MKKLLLSFLLGLCYMSIFGQYKFSLDITATEPLANEKGTLSIFNNRNWNPIKVDSFVIANGHLIINGEVKQPSNIANLSISHNGKNIGNSFVLDSGKNHIRLELSNINYKPLAIHSDTRGNLIFSDLDSLFSQTVTNYPGVNRDINGLLKMSPGLDKEIRRVTLKRLAVYPNDFAGLLYLYRLTRTGAASPILSKDNLAAFAKFSDDLKNSALGKQLYDEETSFIKNKLAGSAGNQVPVFKVTDINNKLFSNNSLKGQPYLIVFSATWCAPCQEELPILKKLYQTYEKQGLKVIYFNNDDNITRWKEHVSKNKLTWINVSEKLKFSQSKIPASFGVNAIPTCLVINKKGLIAYNSDESDTEIKHIESFIKKAINN